MKRWGIQPQRAATLLAGSIILAEAQKRLGLPFELAAGGLREGSALALFREGLSRDAQAPLLHRGLGSLLERNGQLADAVAEYREYARLAPNAADAQQLAERANRLERRLAAASPAPSS